MPLGASLSLHELTRFYEGFGAVKGVSLSLEAGSFLTLLGPSGSGKTTTLMMIAGFAEPTSGRILVNGRDVTHVPAHQRDIGMVFQNYALFPHMTVAENVGFPLRMRKVAKSEAADRVQTFLKMVGLGEYGRRYTHQLSGGQQQRVALARALVFSPSLVLMDEPLGALDRRLRLQMQEEIKGLQSELGLTVVYVTHDQEEALTMSDNIAVMEGGLITSYASPRTTYETPGNRFVAGFVGESNFIRCRVVEAAGGGSTAHIPALDVSVEADTSSHAPGTDAVIFIRPERLRICDDSSPQVNQLAGVVTGEIYLGESSMYRVRLGPDLEVRVKRPNRGYGKPVTVGEPCMVGWRPADAIVLAA
ncbi:ABC transporter ATP-binding protein [Paraburkholderia tropica]|uniref:ABC transporter ATP-binding protein n=1 Tax=Paraburkholderia tropica TaxID=92647 RepID=UPI002AB6D6EA|nr:ABC transporter ATP-binding protein [Paraburkholderia tropica]